VALVAIDGGGHYDSSITALGKTHFALDHFEGLNKRWDFGVNDEGFNYSLVLEPDQSAAYYDFSRAKDGEMVSASAVFFCELVSTAEPANGDLPTESEK
jgi:hypothetical protein